MDKIAKFQMQERQELIIATASKMKVSEAIIEKDFWVCFCLDYLFHECKWKEAFAFKGGTSLSKVYGLIERFSEDIDLILDWRVLGYKKDEPWEDRSNTKQVNYSAIELPSIRLTQPLAVQLLGASMTPLLLSY